MMTAKDAEGADDRQPVEKLMTRSPITAAPNIPIASAAHTMAASTFLNAMQTDYDGFRKETLDAIAYVRTQMPQAQKQATAGATQAHA